MSRNPHAKVIMLGDSGAGKTSLVKRMAQNTFSSEHSATIVVNQSIDVCIHGDTMMLDVWDTAGQEVYRSLVSFYARETQMPSNFHP
jgi:small GTP-binding protein